MSDQYHINSKDALQWVCQEIHALPVDGSFKVTISKIPNKRTLTQNSAIHKYFTILAEGLNDAGYSFNRIILRRPYNFIRKKRKEISQLEPHPYTQGYLKALDDILALLPRVIVSWTGDTVKDFLWRPVQESICSKQSTTELNRDECSKVYDELNRLTASEFGISIEFPSKKNKK